MKKQYIFSLFLLIGFKMHCMVVNTKEKDALNFIIERIALAQKNIQEWSKMSDADFDRNIRHATGKERKVKTEITPKMCYIFRMKTELEKYENRLRMEHGVEISQSIHRKYKNNE